MGTDIISVTMILLAESWLAYHVVVAAAGSLFRFGRDGRETFFLRGKK
jgi:hypothetical protein